MQTMRLTPAIIVVAGGRGSRYGGPQHKLLESLGTTTVLGLTLRHALMTRLPVTVVTTPALAEHAGRIVAARDVVQVPEVPPGGAGSTGLGMGYSIGAGVAARGHAGGWLVLPADMPGVRPETLLAVAGALDEHPVAFAQYQGRRGHPVGFGVELYSELVALRGDEGARRIVARYPAHGVEVDDPGVLFDVDTEEDLRRARQALGSVVDRV
jgi:molybdenum cofactor cytidylyltransferase